MIPYSVLSRMKGTNISNNNVIAVSIIVDVVSSCYIKLIVSYMDLR
jgi:hypothetical protein